MSRYATVEVFLGDFDDDDLIEELESRGYEIKENPDEDYEDQRFYKTSSETMKLNAEKAWDMMASRVYEKTGRIITKEI